MTLRRTMVYQIAALIVGSILIGVELPPPSNRLHQDYGVAAQGYAQLRHVFVVSSHLATARLLLESNPPDRERAANELRAARAQFNRIVDERLSRGEPTEKSAYDDLETALSLLSQRSDNLADNIDQAEASINSALGHLRDLDTTIRQLVGASEQAADQKRKTTMLMLAILTSAVVVGALVIGFRQYASVATPLRRLSEGVRKIASGRFGESIAPQGHAEFVSLAEDFNRMAGELDSLYRELEQKVEVKSRELVRSERLASVGYLAAGVAHEINNPLGIITGYAELCLKQLQQQQRGAGPVSEAEKTLEVICEEAFRCKQIVEKLLSLARSGEENRRAIRVDQLIAAFVQTLAGLKQYEDRKLKLALEAKDDSTVWANETELRQVLLNLTVNALEATSKGSGEVMIGLKRDGNWVQLSVSDNGRGMDAQTLDRVFEPFFTDKRGRGQAGTGLGLSITHAIVESHGGTISASSGGVGQGCNFSVRLPYYQQRSAT